MRIKVSTQNCDSALHEAADIIKQAGRALSKEARENHSEIIVLNQIARKLDQVLHAMHRKKKKRR